jgi:endogenous inhibitor of DNA gyrase (YacG/DUF329 family)
MSEEPKRASAASAQVRRYRCPTCRKQVELGPDRAHRPFCSPRCQMVDLGRWLDEDFCISRPLGPDDHE